MQPPAGDVDLAALFSAALRESWKPREQGADGASIAELDQSESSSQRTLVGLTEGFIPGPFVQR